MPDGWLDPQVIGDGSVFDFIEAAEFRQSLEADYAEMHRCAGCGAWKSVQVLAGSIVEALLIDYLVATRDTRSAVKDPLRMDLAEAIALCTTEGLLNSRTAALSTVVRSYRNLIHPGRVIRLGEEKPSEDSGIIAMKLVDMITAQVEDRRRDTFGLTAEQLLSKIERDDDSIAILRHLLVDVNATQRARFLLDVLPTRYMELKRQETPDDEPWSALSNTLERQVSAYRMVLDSVDEATAKRVAKQFVRILREEDGDTVRSFREAFFRPEDLPMVAEDQRALVKEHLLAATPYHHSSRSADVMAGLAPYLAKQDVRAWADAYIRPIVASGTHDHVRTAIRNAFLNGAVDMPMELHASVDARLDGWIAHYDGREQDADAQYIRDLKSEIESSRLPF